MMASLKTADKCITYNFISSALCFKKTNNKQPAASFPPHFSAFSH